MEFSSLRAALAAGVLVLVACGGDDTGAGADPGGGEGGTPDAIRPGPEGGPPPDPTAGCGVSGVKTGFVGSQSLTVSGKKRTYQLYVPDVYDGKKSYPLVFVFHGDGGDGSGIRSSFQLEAESKGGAIFVYPDGEDKTWHIDDAGSLGKDIAFVDAIGADLGTKLCTDKKRIFAVGFSKGAYFANMLGCLSKSNLRAVVAHGGGGPFGLDGSGTTFDKNGTLVCPAPPVAAMQVVGSNDDLSGDAREARDYWRRVNTCKSSTTAFAPSPCMAYDGCAQDRPEIYCEIPGMGHTIWPQNGTKVTWAFLASK